jgi:hypothetical protein
MGVVRRAFFFLTCSELYILLKVLIFFGAGFALGACGPAPTYLVN